MDTRPLFLYEALGSLVVYVSHGRQPGDAEWSRYLDAVDEVGRQYGQVRVVVFTDGGAPSATQRKQASVVSARYPHRMAVVTASAIARTVTTVLGWLGMDIRAFAPSELDDALKRLEVTERERTWALETSARLRKLVAE